MKIFTDIFGDRGKLATLLFILLSVVLISRLFYLQVIQASYYKEKSENNRIKPVPLIAPRGTIFDRNGKVLVSNRPSYTVYILPYELTYEAKSDTQSSNLEALINKLASILDLEKSFLDKKIKSSWDRKYDEIRLKKGIDFKTLCQLEEQNEELGGVTYREEQTRSYPPTFWSGPILGYVGEKSKEEIKDHGKKVNLREEVGRTGIEKAYDEDLKGENGAEYLEVTATGMVLGKLKEEKPARGSDMVLTLDLDLQTEAESALVDRDNAALVALDPTNGEVLAMVSKPGFDANIFSEFLTEDQWQNLLSDPSHPLLNRCIQGLYPPGSTLKLLTAAAALEEGLVDRNSTFSPCTGSFRFGNRVFRCWKADGHGRLNLEDAIIHSCDVYFYQLGLKLGLSNWCKYAKESSLGEKTELDLPEEQKGRTPTLAYFHRKYGYSDWVNGMVINLAIGQGEISVTPLELACFFSGLVNNGVIYKPQIKKEIKDRKETFKPEIWRKLPFSLSTLKILKEAMIGAVNNPGGTGFFARSERFIIGGKTGTAQNPHGEDHAWFIGFAPAENPKILVCVIVENAGHGGLVAAPVAKRIIEKYLEKCGGGASASP